MTVSVCPIAVVNAPPERIWALLSDPARFDLWWDAHTVTIVRAFLNDLFGATHGTVATIAASGDPQERWQRQ